MIEYCQEAKDWFEANVPYVPTNQQVMSMRLEDAIEHHDMVYLSDMGDTIVHDLAKLDAYCKARDVAEMHHKQDQAKCQAIRAYKPDAEKQAFMEQRMAEFQLKVTVWSVVSFGFLACLVAAWMKWGK